MTAKTSKKGAMIFAIIIFLATIGLVLYFVLADRGYTKLEDIDLSEYSLTEIEVDDVYLNAPDVSGKMIFKNKDGEEKKARLSEANISGFDSDTIGNFEMTVKVGSQQQTVAYSVIYKDVLIDNVETIALSVNDPFELDYILVPCTDYNDRVVANIPLSEIFEVGDFDVDYVTDYAMMASSDYQGKNLTIDYTVGYIGYGNSYAGVSRVNDGGTLYELANLYMFANEQYNGSGELEIYYGTNSGDTFLGADWAIISFDWEVDYLNDNKLEITFEGGQKGSYDTTTHTLEIDADLFDTSFTLSFELKMLRY